MSSNFLAASIGGNRSRPYDLDKPLDRRAVYRQVLTDGTPDDVRWYIEVPKLVAMWHDIILPSHVRYVWGTVASRIRGSSPKKQTHRPFATELTSHRFPPREAQ